MDGKDDSDIHCLKQEEEVVETAPDITRLPMSKKVGGF